MLRIKHELDIESRHHSKFHLDDLRADSSTTDGYKSHREMSLKGATFDTTAENPINGHTGMRGQQERQGHVPIVIIEGNSRRVCILF